MLKKILDEAAARINVPSFVDDDPVQFPRRFTRLQDIEVVAFLVSHISWGNRSMILRDAERLLAMMGGEPYYWITQGAYRSVPDDLNIHRTFFGRNLKHFCRGLELMYSLHGSMEECARRGHIATYEEPAWALASILNGMMSDANQHTHDNRCLPQDLLHSPIKRLNMALRWLVRDDGIVDMGVWNILKPNQLFIPLDVHVGNTARALGLTSRAQHDKRTALEITARLREMRPDDPCLYDFALFGLGIEGTDLAKISATETV